MNIGDILRNRGKDSMDGFKLYKETNDIRKHYTQITDSEFEIIKNKIKPEPPTMTKYIQRKFGEIDLELYQVINNTITEFKNGNHKYLIEYKEVANSDEKRILLRNYDFKRDIVYNGKEIYSSNICFVLSLEENKIITIYWNIATDNHDTLQDDIYTDFEIKN